MLSNIEKKQLARYEEHMAIPKWKFIFIYGVIAWGFSVGILYSLVNLVLGDVNFSGLIRRELWINILAFGLGGVLYGLFLRNFMPKQIKKLKEKELQQ